MSAISKGAAAGTRNVSRSACRSIAPGSTKPVLGSASADISARAPNKDGVTTRSGSSVRAPATRKLAFPSLTVSPGLSASRAMIVGSSRMPKCPSLAAKAPRTVYATLFGGAAQQERETIERILGVIRLGDARSRLAGSLSHGQKQWLEIGMLLAQDPKLLLVDEPVAGMTDAETATTAELLKEIARDHSVVVVEHDMAFVRELGVKVTVLHEGSVLAEGSLDQVSADERVIEVYLGR